GFHRVQTSSCVESFSQARKSHAPEDFGYDLLVSNVSSTPHRVLCELTSNGLLSIKGFNRVLLDVALQRLDIEPERTINLDGRKLPQPGFLVDRVHFQAKVTRSLLNVQEPLTDEFI